MSDFKAKMHQIRFRLGLRPRPRWGAYSDPPDPLPGFNRSYTSKGMGKEGGEERGRDGRKRAVLQNSCQIYAMGESPSCG